jgi:hypothetical protein
MAIADKYRRNPEEKELRMETLASLGYFSSKIWPIFSSERITESLGERRSKKKCNLDTNNLTLFFLV